MTIQLNNSTKRFIVPFTGMKNMWVYNTNTSLKTSYNTNQGPYMRTKFIFKR